MITNIQLQSICNTAKGKSKCGQYVDALNQYMPLYGIDSPLRAAAFIAQIAHESGDFTSTSENLNYSADGLANTWRTRYAEKGPDQNYLAVTVNGRERFKPNALALRLHRNDELIANNVYANRMGNGDESSGDGWLYRGRGLKQLTGKSNYAACAKAIGLPLLEQPNLLEQPEGAVLSACWFWESNRLNRFADTKDLKGLTKSINGGLIGYDDRLKYFEQCQEVLFG